MNFRTTSTIGDQMSHVKKYAPLLLLNLRVNNSCASCNEK